ncbi:MAG: hypothetical protein HC895_17920 [Leptolyngbyaceae cyanobacterium SM1_3_5]|nr:hypothetical protein [Leptolyngbyaceae cyanobacterium SM1_3_5]
MALDAFGQLWVGTLEGLVQIDTASALIRRRVADLPGSTIQAMTRSPEGDLWGGHSGRPARGRFAVGTGAAIGHGISWAECDGCEL